MSQTALKKGWAAVQVAGSAAYAGRTEYGLVKVLNCGLQDGSVEFVKNIAFIFPPKKKRRKECVNIDVRPCTYIGTCT